MRGNMKDTQSRYILVVACAIFLFLGAITGGLGPVLPELARNTSSSLTAVGAVFTAIFLGALLSQLITGPVSDVFGQKKVLFFSLLVLTVGTIGFTITHSFLWMLVVTFLAGLGHGGVDLGTNVLVSRTFTQKNASVMNLLHFFYGLGAFIGPAMISLSMALFAKGIIVLWIASGAMTVLAFLVLGMKVCVDDEQEPSVKAITKGKVYTSATLWLLGGLLLLYVGIENGIGGWATTYMNTTVGMGVEKGALVTSGFWGALTIGRLVTALIGNRWSQKQILTYSFLLLSAFGLVFSFSVNISFFSILSIIAIGFFSGAVYPTTMSLITTTYNASPGKAASVGAAMGSIGGMTIPWLQGYLLENVSPQTSAWFVTTGLFLMLVVLWISDRNSKAGSKTESAIAGNIY